MSKIGFVFFGSSEFSCRVLDKLLAGGFLPTLIVTTPDKPQGRKLVITPSPVKMLAEKHSIACLQPEKLNDKNFSEKLTALSADLFIVASYGKIIPKNILNIPKHGTLNVHPSLLPKLRGATPIQSAILNEEKTGVTIMLVDEKVDHGPIVVQEEVAISDWPPYADRLRNTLAEAGGKLLVKILPGWVEGKIKATEQDHARATFTKKIKKEDGLLDLLGNAEENLKKIRAYRDWPTAYFFADHKGKKLRVVVREAEMSDGKLEITKVIPEGKKEMSYEDFLRGVR